RGECREQRRFGARRLHLCEGDPEHTWAIDAYGIVFTSDAPVCRSTRSSALIDASGGFSTPTRIVPSETDRSYSFVPRAGIPAATSNPPTVASTAPSIVNSNITMRFGHIATIGIPPVSS